MSVKFGFDMEELTPLASMLPTTAPISMFAALIPSGIATRALAIARSSAETFSFAICIPPVNGRAEGMAGLTELTEFEVSRALRLILSCCTSNPKTSALSGIGR